MFYVFERIEGNFAVLISDENIQYNIIRNEIRGKIGDIFTKDGDGKFILNQEETDRRHANIVSRHRSLFKK